MSEVIATLRNAATGEERQATLEYGDDADDSGIAYTWAAGNYSCDCNRAIFFGDEADQPCGHERFVLVRLTVGGREINVEDWWPQ